MGKSSKFVKLKIAPFHTKRKEQERYYRYVKKHKN